MAGYERKQNQHPDTTIKIPERSYLMEMAASRWTQQDAFNLSREDPGFGNGIEVMARYAHDNFRLLYSDPPLEDEGDDFAKYQQAKKDLQIIDELTKGPHALLNAKTLQRRAKGARAKLHAEKATTTSRP